MKGVGFRAYKAYGSKLEVLGILGPSRLRGSAVLGSSGPPDIAGLGALKAYMNQQCDYPRYKEDCNC